MAFGSIEIVSMTNFSQQMDKQTEQMTKQVTGSDQADWYNQKQDAKEKGKNEYRGDGGRKRKKQDAPDRATRKDRGGFDIKI